MAKPCGQPLQNVYENGLEPPNASLTGIGDRVKISLVRFIQERQIGNAIQEIFDLHPAKDHIAYSATSLARNRTLDASSAIQNLNLSLTCTQIIWDVTQTNTTMTYDPPISAPEELMTTYESQPDAKGLVKCTLQQEPAKQMVNLKDIPILIAVGEA